MPHNQPIWQIDRVVDSDAAAGRQLLNEVIDQLETRGWPQHDVFGVHLAMEEALVNAIQHGNGQDANKHVHVVCSLCPDRIRIEVADEGRGFNPTALPDPTRKDRVVVPYGRGVMLMKAFMLRVEFNPQGNQVVLEKERSQSNPSPNDSDR